MISRCTLAENPMSNAHEARLVLKDTDNPGAGILAIVEADQAKGLVRGSIVSIELGPLVWYWHMNSKIVTEEEPLITWDEQVLIAEVFECKCSITGKPLTDTELLRGAQRQVVAAFAKLEALLVEPTEGLNQACQMLKDVGIHLTNMRNKHGG